MRPFPLNARTVAPYPDGSYPWSQDPLAGTATRTDLVTTATGTATNGPPDRHLIKTEASKNFPSSGDIRPCSAVRLSASGGFAPFAPMPRKLTNKWSVSPESHSTAGRPTHHSRSPLLYAPTRITSALRVQDPGLCAGWARAAVSERAICVQSTPTDQQCPHEPERRSQDPPPASDPGRQP